MKKIFLIALIALSFTAGAQVQSFSHTASNPTGGYTGSTSDTMTISLAGGYSSVGVQPVVTKVSGTVAGNSVLYGSIDGVNFYATGDTLFNTNIAVNNRVFRLTTPVYRKIRVISTGTGTMAATTSATLNTVKAY